MKSSGRKALQPRNIFVTPKEVTLVKKKPKAAAEVKENLNLETIIDASLAEELSAFKKKLERLREDRESIEKLLKERDEAMDLQLSHLIHRGETQKSLEIQVDRLFRLKELHAYSSVGNLRSLRAKEHEKRRRFSFEPTTSGEPEEESFLNKNLKRDIQYSLEEAQNSASKVHSSSKNAADREMMANTETTP